MTEKNDLFKHLPFCAAEYIRLVTKKMCYRRSVCEDVADELAAHFEDELRDSQTPEEREKKSQDLIGQFGDPKLLAVLMRRAKKRCRPLWQIIAERMLQTAGIAIVYFVLYCIYISLGQPVIRVNYVEKANLITHPVADESLNAVNLYQKAIDNYKESPTIRELGQENREIRLSYAIRDKMWITELTENESAALKQWISDNTEAVEFFKQAAQKPYCWWQRKAKDNAMVAVLYPELSTIRNLVKLMIWDAKLKAYNGDIETAFNDLFICYRVGMHFKGPRAAIEQLVGLSIQSLANHTALVILKEQVVDGELLKRTQIEFENLITNDTYVFNYDSEKLLALDIIQRCYTDDGKGDGQTIPREIKIYVSPIELSLGLDTYHNQSNDPILEYRKSLWSLAIALASPDRQKTTEIVDNTFQIVQQWANETPWQLKQKNIDVELGISNWSAFKRTRLWILSMLLPSCEKLNQLAYGHKANAEAVISVLAIIRHKQDVGQFPKSLEELADDGYLNKIPMDPYNDGPLVYRKTADDFILYSVSRDFKDDNGQDIRDSTGKIESWPDKGDMVFWPLYNSDGTVIKNASN